MSFKLRRTVDGAGDAGASSESIALNEDGTFKAIVDYQPILGCCLRVGSPNARSYSENDFWMTTPVTQIIEETKTEASHYVRFKTRNSEYEWWNGEYPK